MSVVDAYRARRQKRMDEFKESNIIRDEHGRFASKGGSEMPEKIKDVIGKSYYSRDKKIDEISKVLGRMKIGSKFSYVDDRGVEFSFEKADKGDDGWRIRIKGKSGWSKPEAIKRSLIGAHMLLRK